MAYVAINKPVVGEWWEYQETRTGLAVIIEDEKPIYTGLVDTNGVGLFRIADKVPVGFHKP